MRKKTEMTILFTILLFSLLMVLWPIFFYNPFQLVTTIDYWTHVIKMRQFDDEGIINYVADWTNIYMINGGQQNYPPGHQILLYSLKILTGVGYYSPSFIPLLFAPLFSLMLYLIARKNLGRSAIALLSAFMGASLAPGSNMLGPVYPLASSLGIIMLLSAILILLSSADHVGMRRVFLASLFFGTIFMSHRASFLAIIILLPFITLLPFLFSGNRKTFFGYFMYPLLISTVSGLLLSLIYWINLPIEVIMNFGGILPVGIDQIIGFEVSKFQLAIIVYGLAAALISSQLLIERRVSRDLKPFATKKLTSMELILMSTVFPAFLVGLIIFFIISNGLRFPTTPSDIIPLWKTLSLSAHHDYISMIIKQMAYAWHWNVLPLLLVVPSAYLLLRSNRKNILLSASIGAIITIMVLVAVQEIFFEIKIQRIYLYTAPFAFFLSAWGCYTLLRDGPFDKVLHKVFIVCIPISIALALITSIHAAPPTSEEAIHGITWTKSEISPNEVIAGTYSATKEGRAIGQMNYVIWYGLFTINDPDSLSNYLQRLHTDYVFISPGMGDLNEKLATTDGSYVIYQTKDTHIYVL